MIVREAQRRDLAALVDLGRRMHAESRYGDLPFDGRCVLLSLVCWMAAPEVRVAVAEDDARAIAGAFVGAIGRWYFNGLLQAHDLALFVAPEHRGSRAASLLVADFLQWAADAGCVEATIATSTGVRPEASARFLGRAGFAPCGGVFKQRLRPAPGEAQ